MQRNCSRAATGTPVRLQATVKHVACVSRPQPDCHFADTPLSIPVGNSLLDGEGGCSGMAVSPAATCMLRRQRLPSVVVEVPAERPRAWLSKHDNAEVIRAI